MQISRARLNLPICGQTPEQELGVPACYKFVNLSKRICNNYFVNINNQITRGELIWQKTH